MPDSRHHHYISECYLNGFGVLRKKGKYQLHVFDRVQREHFPTSSRNVAGERDFNRLDEGQSEDPNALEKAYAEFESSLAPAIKRVAEASAFTSDEDRNLIMNMIALFALRNPRWREQMRALHEDIANRMMDLALASKERWESQVAQMKRSGVPINDDITYQELRKFVKEKNYKIGLNRGYQIGTELKTFDTLLPLIARRKWWLVRAHRNSGGFVTSDHPVALMWSDPSLRGGPFPPGFGLRGTQVTFPLTSRVAMIGAFDIKEQTNEIVDPIVSQINGTTIANSERQVYARDLNFNYILTRDGGFRKAARLINDSAFVARKHREENAQ